MTKRKKKSTFDRTAGDKKVAVIWTRVSTKEQADNNLSLDVQEKACRDYAARNGIEIDCLKGGTNESAKQEGKLYQDMITYVSRHRHINTILVYSYDRFSRAGAEAIVTKAYLKSKGISVVSVTQPIDGDSIAGEFMENMLFLFNQFENNLRKDKCTAGMLECLEKGDWFSQPPMGYSIDKTSKVKHTLIINEAGYLLGEAFRWKAYEGLSNVEIIKRLEARGFPKKIYPQRLTEIFHNPFYCGKIRHYLLGKDDNGNDRIVQGNHPPIVDETTWEIVNKTESHIGYTHAKVVEGAPLKKHVICPVCGHYMTGYQSKGIWYYKCNTDGCKCNKRADVMHDKYGDVLDSYAIPKDLRSIVVEETQRVLREGERNLTEQMRILRARITKLNAQKDDVAMRYGLGEIPGDVYRLTNDALTKRISDAEAELKETENNSSNFSNVVESTVAIACHLRALWDGSDYEMRQEVQKMAFPEGIVWNRENDNYLTPKENLALVAFRSISDSYKNSNTKKEDKSFDLSSVVAEAGLEPTTSGL